jgi:long-chain acyl-CoA synthetase
MANSIADFLITNFGARPQECAYRQRRGYRTQSFTYRQVANMAASFAVELDRRSIAKGDRVMLWGENCAEWVAAFFGCVLRGVIVVPMDDGASPDFAARVIEQVQAKLLVASRERSNHAPASARVPTLILEELPAASGNKISAAVLDATDILQIVFTSGATAAPKGVVITHANVLANTAPLEREIERYLKYERFVHPLRFLNLLPLSHVFGQFLGMFLPPLLGGTVIFQKELNPSEVIQTIRRERVSVLVGVPRVLESLKQKVERDLEDSRKMAAFKKRFSDAKDKHFLHRWWIFRAIRRRFGWKFLAFISGGAALDPETEEFWGRLGYAAIQGYGLTETTSLISLNHPFRLGKGSIGKVLPGREVKLAEDGEILVKGGGVASGYWGDGQQGVSDDQGWYRTGDIGALDPQGNLYFKGRKKEIIVTPGGTNVYPADLERALRLQPEVKDCVVVGIERGGNAEPCGVLILHPSGGAAGAVVGRANDSLAEHQRIRLWVEWPDDDFPRTNTQKPRRNVIADAVNTLLQGPGVAYQDSQARAAGGPLTELVSRVAKRPVTTLRSDASLDSDLGLSSLDRVELMGALEDRYQIDLSETRFSCLRTVGDLERMLRGNAVPPTPYHYPGWALRWPVRWIRVLAQYLLMRPAILLLGWPRVIGRENLRGVKGPLLVICNHLGDVDPGFVLTALPARLRYRLAIATGGETLEALRSPSSGRHWLLRIYDRWQWVLGVSLLNLFPLPREAGFRRSFAYVGEAVDRGYSVLVFPEGRHTADGKLCPFRSGIGLLAEDLGIPVVPMRIDGLFEYKQAGRHFAPPWKICVRLGVPIQFADGTDAAQIAAELRKAVEDL